MKTLTSFFLAFYTFSSSLLFGEIQELNNFSSLIIHTNQSTLVVIDLDDTIFFPMQTLGSYDWFEYRLLQNQSMGLGLNEAIAKTEDEFELVRNLSSFKLVENEVSMVLQHINKDRVHILGLSSHRPTFALAMRKHLQALSIEFNNESVKKDLLYFHKNHQLFLYLNGVVFSGWKKKMEAFSAFHSFPGKAFNKIIYVAKNMDDLLSAQAISNSEGYEFLGLHYDYQKSSTTSFRSDIADIQWALSTFDHILNDEEAQDYLNWISPK